jgi:ribonuclease VapC
MVIDTSAAFAIIAQEPDADLFAETIEAFDERRMSAVSILELNIVVANRFGSADIARVEQFLTRADVRSIPFDADCERVATSAFVRFGKGRHAAALNFGDCAAYALAQLLNEPLLFKGGDFLKTDVKIALERSGDK